MDLESSLVAELQHSEPNLLVSNPPKQVTFLGSDLIMDSQNASESSVSQTLMMLKPSKKVTFQEPSINIEPRLSPLPVSSMSPKIASPSLPPYDPITNYLSPRPQFLRYRPNPRIQAYLRKYKGLEMGEGRSLEEGFLSDSSSDTGSEESSEEGSPSPSVDLTTEELEGDSLVAALNPSTTVDVKRELKQNFFTWRKIIGLLEFFLVAFSLLSLTESPVFSRLSQIAAEAGNLEPVQFANLTTLLENPFDDDGYFIVERPVEQVYAQEDDSENVEEIEGEGEQPLEESLEAYTESEGITMDDNLQESESIEAQGEGEGIEVSLEETEPYIEAEGESLIQLQSDEFVANSDFQDQSVTAEAYTESEGITMDDNLQESERIEAEGEGEGIEVSLEETEPYIEAEGKSLIHLQSDEFVANSNFQDQSVTVEAPEQVLEAKPELVSSGDTEHVEDLASGDAERKPEVDTSLPNLSGDNKLSESYKKAVFPLVVLALVIIATAKADSKLTKKMNPKTKERPEVDVMGESCPSEMSSFEKTSSYYSKRGYRETTANEAQSQERKQRKVSKRESLASSFFDFSARRLLMEASPHMKKSQASTDMAKKR